MLLSSLQQNVSQLKGLGQKRAESFGRLGIYHISELLCHFPLRYIDRISEVSFYDAYSKGIEANTQARILAHEFIPWKQSGYKQNFEALKLIVSDANGDQAALLCFGRNFLQRQLPVGKEIRLAAKFQLRYNELQSSSFVWEELGGNEGAYTGGEFGRIIPVYPLSQGLSQKQVRQATSQALELFAFTLQDEIPSSLLKAKNLMPKKLALQQIHYPESFQLLVQAHRSLCFEELFHLMLLIHRRKISHHSAILPHADLHFPHNTQMEDSLSFQLACQELPFELTKGQLDALREIHSDFCEQIPMQRLLQGDVGCGKSLVAYLSSFFWVERGKQVVFMAPTETLAQQLYSGMQELLEAMGLSSEANWQCCLFTGKIQAKERRELLGKMHSGDVSLVFGTHALFSQQVSFHSLAYIVVDEQHRFGVAQRLALHAKSKHAHMLLMSATPIPRSLALSLYGDLKLSSIHQMPRGRQPVKTHLVKQSNDRKVYEFVRAELEKGHQAYFLYPVIEDDPDSPLRSIEEMQELLAKIFPDYRLAALHGKLSSDEKSRIMEQFRCAEVQILLATTVIEVGINVANASCMVIEHAEKFGLAQLHQLRGRVGRGSLPSYCFLIYAEQLSDVSKQRLMAMKNSSDGFAIAEQDLLLRGPGDLLGQMQSGDLNLRLCSFPKDLSLLEEASQAARELLEKDFGLLDPDNQVLRNPQIFPKNIDIFSS